MNSDYQKKSQLNIIGDGSNLNNLKKIAKNNPQYNFLWKKKSRRYGQILYS
jgi:hypothetical protein